MSRREIATGLINVELLNENARKALQENIEQLLPYVTTILEAGYIPVGVRVLFPGANKPEIYALVPVPAEEVGKYIDEWRINPPTFYSLAKLYKKYVEEGRHIFPIIELFNLVPILPSTVDIEKVKTEIESNIEKELKNLLTSLAKQYNVTVSKYSASNLVRNYSFRTFTPVIEVVELGYIPLVPLWNYFRSDLLQQPIIVESLRPEEYVRKHVLSVPSFSETAEKTLRRIVTWIANRVRPVFEIASIFLPRISPTIDIRNMNFARVKVKHGNLTGYLGYSFEKPILFLNLSLADLFHPTTILVPSGEENKLNTYKLLSWLESLELTELLSTLKEKINNKSIYVAISEEPEEYYPAVKKYSGKVPLIVKLVMNSELRSLLNRAKPYNAFLTLRSLLNKIGREAAARYTMQLEEEEDAPLRLIYEISNKKPRLVGVEKINNIL